MTQKRTHYAVKSVGLSKCGENVYTILHGVQSLGLNTRFNLEQVFEFGQLEIYENSEALPDIEASVEKVLDGYAPIYMQATKGAVSATLAGRSNIRTTLGLSVYSDQQDAASGTPLKQVICSGMYINNLNWNFQVNGPFTESVTLVGNNKVTGSSFSATAFTNADEPLAIAGSGGVNRREDLLTGEAAGVRSKFPADIPGISASGYLPYSTVLGEHAVHIQSVRVSTSFGRDALLELGKRGPFHRYAQFPTEVRTDIEILDQETDQVDALEESESNLSNRTIYLACREGTKLDLGSRNKLSSITYGGGNAGQNGGNTTITYSYSNYNSLSVTHPQDPSGL